MIERRGHRPPVTYTTFQARDLGSDTANLFKTALEDAYERFRPEAMIGGASCTAELIQDDPGGMSEMMGLPVPTISLELPSYQRRKNFGADETRLRMPWYSKSVDSTYLTGKRLGIPCAVISAPCMCRTSPRATRPRWGSKAPT